MRRIQPIASFLTLLLLTSGLAASLDTSGLVDPAPLADPGDPVETADGASAGVVGAVAGAKNATLDEEKRRQTEVIGEAVAKLQQVNSTYKTLADLLTTAVETSDLPRSTAMGAARILQALLEQQTDAVVVQVNGVAPQVGGPAGTALDTAYGTFLTTLDNVNASAATVRSLQRTLNQTEGQGETQANTTAWGASGTGNQTRDSGNLTLTALLGLLNGTRATLFGAAGIDPVETANQTSAAGVGVVASAKNVTIEEAKRRQTEVLGEAVSKLRVLNTTYKTLVDQAALLAQSADGPRSTAMGALRVLQALLEAQTDAVVAQLNGVAPDVGGPAGTALDTAYGTFLTTLDNVNGTAAALPRTLLLALNQTEGEAETQANGTAWGAGATGNQTRDSGNLTLTQVLGAINGTRANVIGAAASVVATLDAEDLLAGAPSAAETAGLLRLEHPRAGSHNRSATPVRVNTSLPSDATSGPALLLEYAPAGTSDWTTAGEVDCPGQTPRTCTFAWTHGLNGDHGLRLSYGAPDLCRVGQCATSGGAVHFDTVVPVTTVTALPATTTSRSVSIAFAAEPETTPELLYRVNATGGYQTSGLAASGGAFLFQAPWDGFYEFIVRSTDLAGNVEAKASSDARTNVTLAVDVTSTVPTHAVSGESLSVQACVTVRGAPVANTTPVVARFRGADHALTAGSGCTWSASVPLGEIASIGTEPLWVNATVGSASGSVLKTVTLSPARLVTLAFEERVDRVPVGDTVTFAVSATYADDGEPADDVRVDATAGGSTSSWWTSPDGLAYFFISKDAAQSLAYTFSATVDRDEEGATSSVSATPLQATAVWTGLTGTRTATQRASGFSNVGEDFDITYCADWTHDGSNASGVDVSVAVDGGAVTFGAVTGADGCAVVSVNEATAGARAYAASLLYDDGETTPFMNDLAGTTTVTFTRIQLSLNVDDAYIGVTETATFTVGAVWEHDAALSTDGITVAIRALDNATIANATIDGDDDNGNATHTFNGVYSGNVTARVTGSTQGVTSQLGPVPEVSSMIATRLVVGTITANKTLVTVAHPIRVQVPLTWAHDASAAIASATVQLTPSGESPRDCTWDAATKTATCDLTQANVFSGTFAVSATSQGVSRLAGTTATPTLTWTRVSLSVSPVGSTFVDVDAPIAYAVQAAYAHGGAVEGATVQAATGTGTVLGSCVTNATGACQTSLVSSAVYNGTASFTVVANPAGVTELSAPVSTSGNLVWTRLVVSSSSGSGALSTGAGAGFVVAVKYAHDDTAVPGAIVTFANFSIGTQSNSTNATGGTVVDGIERAAGTRELSISVRDVAGGISAQTFTTGQTVSKRWTALAFRNYTFDPAPVRQNSTHAVFGTNTAVNVCAIVVAADTDQPVPGATVSLRGVTRTADETGKACLTVAKSSKERTLTFTAHGVSGTIDGATITSSINRSLKLVYESNPSP